MNLFGRITRRGLLGAAPAAALAAATVPALAAIEAGPEAPAAAAGPPWPPSPWLVQYMELKAQHPGAILLYQMGQFFESYFDDALAVAGALDIALTTRGAHQGEPIPMTGFPIYRPPFAGDSDGELAEDYTSRCIGALARAGHRVALAYHVESAAQAKTRGDGPVRREVLAIVDPVTGWRRV
jgi:DNA mismatch repair protein MutS